MFDPQGWYLEARHCPSPHCNERPQNIPANLLVIHNISLPAGQFGQPHIEALFSGTLDCACHPDFESLRELKVSSHFVIYRDGSIVQHVPIGERAWHAGKSVFQGRENCNDFSIGIEMEGTDYQSYESDQYNSLVTLTQAIMSVCPDISLGRIVGHCDIAPGRKTDPGPAFDWQRYRAALRELK
ncbi:1,6-anhydro-N-acetylmuramyl-L-alanine amidase AmpD [Bowmanella sp. Y26]|uniref:1,6-anhydro-N-acetylmuramyl-L-alanine amidase AmpD n=1 Tax=Bowmanella yangjiangensis TaxID=2811230 RepID=UPI001BDBB1EF|nr:1,6-anhydro-N-acetylmuramyl-L-alanine amidase AmpD [Bowmanella yangjiangensis]MBT1062103.1 1,6-anhydro-N-acetylmuramyl-L-alanine amidase AmpD [Bowmanella yangjiangensis]